MFASAVFFLALLQKPDAAAPVGIHGAQALQRCWDGSVVIDLQNCSVPPSPPPPPSPPTRGFVEGTEFIIDEPFTYTIGSTHISITVPKGFVTDFASIPPVLRGVLERQGQYSRAALIHDYLYWTQRCTRAQSDNLLMIAMTEGGVSVLERQEIYRGVRLGGSFAWYRNAIDRQAGKPRVVPAQMFNLADHHTWAQAQAVLIARRIHDPVMEVSPAACALGNATNVP